MLLQKSIRGDVSSKPLFQFLAFIPFFLFLSGDLSEIASKQLNCCFDPYDPVPKTEILITVVYILNP